MSDMNRIIKIIKEINTDGNKVFRLGRRGEIASKLAPPLIRKKM